MHTHTLVTVSVVKDPLYLCLPALGGQWLTINVQHFHQVVEPQSLDNYVLRQTTHQMFKQNM